MNTECKGKMAINNDVECSLAASVFGLKWLGAEGNSSDIGLSHWFPGCSYHVAAPHDTLNKVVLKRHSISAKCRDYISKNIAYRQLCKAPGIIEILF